jgi:hypothetical protein
MSGPGGQHSSRAAAALRPQSAPWSNRMGPSGTDDTGPLPAQRPRSVVTTSLSPMVGHHAGNLPRTHLRGTGEHLLVLVLPSQPTGTLALDLLPCRPAGEAAPQPVRVRWGGPGLVSTLVRATHGHPSTIPSRQAPCGQAAAPPADHGGTSNPYAQRGRPAAPSHSRVQRGADSTAAEPRTPKARPSGHLDGTGRVDTGRVDTGRPRDRLDGRPHGGQRTRTGDDRRGRRPDGHPRDGRPPAGGRPDLARVAASRGAWPPITAAVTTPAPRPWSPPLNNCAASPLGRASAHCSPLL